MVSPSSASTATEACESRARLATSSVWSRTRQADPREGSPDRPSHRDGRLVYNETPYKSTKKASSMGAFSHFIISFASRKIIIAFYHHRSRIEQNDFKTREEKVKLQQFIRSPIGFFTVAIFVTLLWGSPAPLIKLSYGWLSIKQNDYGKEILFAGYRFLLASGLLYLLLRVIQKQKVFTAAAFQSLSKVGFIQNFLQYVFFYIGISLSSSMVTVIFTGTTSLFQILIAHFLDSDDRLNLRKILGVVVGFLGIFVVGLHTATTGIGLGLGEILLLISNLAAAIGNLLARKKAASFHVGIVTFYELFIGSLCLTIVGIVKVGFLPFHFSLLSGSVLVYLALVAVAGMYLWNTLLQYHPVSKVSMFLFLIPVFGVFYSAILVSEELTLYTFIGLVLVSIGILIVNLTKPRVTVQKQTEGI